jgi:sortase A
VELTIPADTAQPPELLPGPDGGTPKDDREFLASPVRRTRPPLPSGAAAVVWILAAVSGLALWALLYGYVFSGFQESSAQRELYATLRSNIALGVAPLGGSIKLGTPVAFLQIPEAGIDQVVVAGTTSGALEQGPGLEADTPLPGQAGVSVVFGRQALFGGPFRHLGDLKPGDLFRVTTGAGVFTYKVIDLRYPGDPYPPPLAAGGSRLTLVTLVASGFTNAGVNDQYLYADADLVGKPVASPPGLPTAVPVNQEPMHGNDTVLIALVFWLQLLVIAAVVAAWIGSQWAVWQTWLVAAPAIVALLWVISETAFQLLPNLL